ncbi:MAG: hypothetical protein M1834_002428 [Cirrosporium novae-zelandiae]|nr:MAG: hypothetical protein M1834_002428 [Cirrosporium novae-zelandiae]
MASEWHSSFSPSNIHGTQLTSSPVDLDHLAQIINATSLDRLRETLNAICRDHPTVATSALNILTKDDAATAGSAVSSGKSIEKAGEGEEKEGQPANVQVTNEQKEEILTYINRLPEEGMAQVLKSFQEKFPDLKDTINTQGIIDMDMDTLPNNFLLQLLTIIRKYPYTSYRDSLGGGWSAPTSSTTSTTIRLRHNQNRKQTKQLQDWIREMGSGSQWVYRRKKKRKLGRISQVAIVVGSSSSSPEGEDNDDDNDNGEEEKGDQEEEARPAKRRKKSHRIPPE